MKLQFCYYSEKSQKVVEWGEPIDTERKNALEFFENHLLSGLMKEGGGLIYFYVVYEPTTNIFTDEYDYQNVPCLCGHSAETHLRGYQSCLHETKEESFGCSCAGFSTKTRNDEILELIEKRILDGMATPDEVVQSLRRGMGLE